MSTTLGELVARGSRSCVYAIGTTAVAKVPNNAARYSVAAFEAGAPAPKLLGIETLNGRTASIWERVRGNSMWEEILRHPGYREAHARTLAEVEHGLVQLVPSVLVRVRTTDGRARSVRPPRLSIRRLLVRLICSRSRRPRHDCATETCILATCCCRPTGRSSSTGSTHPVVTSSRFESVLREFVLRTSADTCSRGSARRSSLTSSGLRKYYSVSRVGHARTSGNQRQL